MGLFTNLRWSLAQRGAAGTLRAVVAALQRRRRPAAAQVPPHPFDEQHGLDTSGMVLGRELARGEARAAEVTGYAGVSVSRFEEVMARWCEFAGEAARFAFADIGCGKGRALMLASRQGFREVWGIELDRGLASIAERNLATWQNAGLARCPVKLVRGEATLADVPEGPLVLFLYNPFSPAVLRRLLDRMEERQRAGGGELWVVYYKENADNPLRADGRVQLAWRGVPCITAEERPYDPVAAEDDEVAIYRWRN